MTVCERRLRLADTASPLGLDFGQDGPMLAGLPHLRRTITGLVPRPDDELGALMKSAHGCEPDLARLAASMRMRKRAKAFRPCL